MRITQNMLSPSREDAVRLNRSEKMSMILMAYIASVLEDLKSDLSGRLAMVDGGQEKMNLLSETADDLLNELRVTIPLNQRMHLQNTAQEYEVRLSPKLTPYQTNVVMQKSEFKELVDHAREKCRDCTEDDETCERCGLFRLLTVILPLDDYHDGLLCPYNLGEWAN